MREKRVGKSGRSTNRKIKKIDFSDIPEIDSNQMSMMKRVGRPPLGETTKQLIALRIEPRVVEELKELASKEGVGYQTLINQILERYLKAA